MLFTSRLELSRSNSALFPLLLTLLWWDLLLDAQLLQGYASLFVDNSEMVGVQAFLLELPGVESGSFLHALLGDPHEASLAAYLCELLV